MNTWGKNFKITVFGESHGRCVGVVIDGCPPGIEIDLVKIQKEVDKRKPGQNLLTSSRKEEDKVEIFSGVFNNRSTGAPICLIVFNHDVDSAKYEKIKNLPRPGHADFPAFFKYHGFNDYRGGGIFSGRLTLAFVMAGAIAQNILEREKIKVLAYTKQIGKIKAGEKSIKDILKNREENLINCGDLEAARKMEKLIMKVKKEKDSVGGVIECCILNLPIGLGEPLFDNLESKIAQGIFSIPAIKGIEFGSGFFGATLKGSENNDQFYLRKGRIVTKTNNAGGILGGISNGAPLVFRVAVKPTPSIGKPQHTVDLVKKKARILQIEGRHDPCIVPRAVPVVEAITSLAIVDLWLEKKIKDIYA